MTTRTCGWDGRPLSDADKRFFALRESGYRGWIDQDGRAVSAAEHDRRLQRARTESDMSGAQLVAPPRGQPYTPRPTTGGSAVAASIMEIKQALAQANSAIGDAQAPIQRAIDEATNARAAIQASMDGSSQSDAEAQIAVLTAMIGSLEDALGRSHQALDGNYSMAGRL